MKQWAVIVALCALAALGCRALPMGKEGLLKVPQDVLPPADEAGKFLTAVSAVGPSRDRQAMVDKADRLAREKLASATAAHARKAVAAFLKRRADYPAPTSPLGEEFCNALAAEVSAEILRQPLQYETISGPDGEVYVLYRVPIAMLNNTVHEKFIYTLSHINPFGAHSEQVAEEFKRSLQTELDERLKEALRVRPEGPSIPPAERVPAWLELGRHRSYPPEEFFSAIGVGRKAEDAEANARAELAELVDRIMASRVRALAGPSSRGPAAENVKWLRGAALSFTQDDLICTRTAEQWCDKVTNTYYAFCVLDRGAAAVLYRRWIAASLDEWRSLSASAQDHAQAGRYVAALNDLVKALAAGQRAAVMQARALAVVPDQAAGEFHAMISEPVVSKARDQLQALLSSIRLDKTGGDAQWTPPGVPPKEPLQVTLTAVDSGKPLAGLPVRFLSPVPQRSPQEPVMTDARGVANLTLSAVPRAGAAYTVIAELDLEHLFPGSDVYRLVPPRAEFRHVLRSRSNTSVAVYVRELSPTGRPLSSPLASQLQDTVRAQGFTPLEESVVSRHAASYELTPDLPEDQIVSAFADLRASLGAGRFLLMVMGKVETKAFETVQTTEGPLYIFHCPYTLKILDPDLPGNVKTVCEISGVGKGAYVGDAAEAVRRAQADTAAGAAARLTAALQEKFGPPGTMQ